MFKVKKKEAPPNKPGQWTRDAEDGPLPACAPHLPRAHREDNCETCGGSWAITVHKPLCKRNVTFPNSDSSIPSVQEPV